MSDNRTQGWEVARIGGWVQWFQIVVGLLFCLASFLVFAKGQSFHMDLAGSDPGRPDMLMIPLIAVLCGLYCLNQATRARFKWNADKIKDTSRYFVMREFSWVDLTDIQPAPDGVGRSLIFGKKGDISLTQTGGSGTLPLRTIWRIEELAREKLKENARTS